MYVARHIQEHTERYFLTIMADETADISNKEQLVACIGSVDENFVVREEFIGMYPMERRLRCRPHLSRSEERSR